jgi:hypothetical protein
MQGKWLRIKGGEKKLPGEVESRETGKVWNIISTRLYPSSSRVNQFSAFRFGGTEISVPPSHGLGYFLSGRKGKGRTKNG